MTAEAQILETLGYLMVGMQSMNDNMSTLTTKVDELTTKVDVLTERVDVLTVRVDDLTDRLDNLTTEFYDFRQQTNERFDAIDQRLGRIEVRLDNLEIRVAHIENTMVTKDDLDKILIEHQKDILGMLTHVSKKLDARTERCDCRFEALNERLFRQEGHLKHVLQHLDL